MTLNGTEFRHGHFLKDFHFHRPRDINLRKNNERVFNNPHIWRRRFHNGRRPPNIISPPI